MEKVSFEDIGMVAATFASQEGVKGGQVVKVTDNGQVGPCEAGDQFCGVALEGRGGFAGVQVKGFVTVKATGTVDLGWTELCADGAGGVKAAASGGSGRAYLVVDSDSTAGTAVLCL